MKTKSPTLAELQTLADTLRRLHAETNSYWDREQMPPEKLIAARNAVQNKLASTLLPLVQTLCAGGFFSFSVWKGTFADNLNDDKKRAFLEWSAYDAHENGGINLEAYGHSTSSSIPAPTLADIHEPINEAAAKN